LSIGVESTVEPQLDGRLMWVYTTWGLFSEGLGPEPAPKRGSRPEPGRRDVPARVVSAPMSGRFGGDRGRGECGPLRSRRGSGAGVGRDSSSTRERGAVHEEPYRRRCRAGGRSKLTAMISHSAEEPHGCNDYWTMWRVAMIAKS
jgi:hypothetical protein